MTFFDHSNLRRAFEEYVGVQDALLPDEEALACVTFSERFEERMRRMIRRQRYGYYVLFGTAARRVASVLIALLIAATVATVSVEALREKVAEFFVRVYEKYTQVFFVEDAPALSREITIEPKRPTYIPEGYEIVEEELTEVTYYVMYANDNREYFCLEQRSNGAGIQIDTEESRYITINIIEQCAVIYQNKETISILFTDDIYSYDLCGDCSIEDLISIAESIL